MKRFFAILICLSFVPLALPQTTPQNASLPPVQRHVQGQTIVSNELPAADFTLTSDFQYVGTQVVNLYGNALAEQHLFVKSASGAVQSFCWLQFEHRLPAFLRPYNYPLPGSTEMGGLPFVYDTKAFLAYDDSLKSDPQSDGFAISKLLATKNLSFPHNAARIRMFHLPTPDHLSELMIIYGESLPGDSKIPASAEGVLLDEASPDFTKLLLAHVKQSLTIHKH
ncbi:MAG TPA: hypothetical protein VKD70_17190 [Candidatus Acidoferrum sp.]|nr:hypothetical protein [Candidatus Acidoferrum sp.]